MTVVEFRRIWRNNGEEWTLDLQFYSKVRQILPEMEEDLWLNSITSQRSLFTAAWLCIPETILLGRTDIVYETRNTWCATCVAYEVLIATRSAAARKVLGDRPRPDDSTCTPSWSLFISRHWHRRYEKCTAKRGLDDSFLIFHDPQSKSWLFLAISQGEMDKSSKRIYIELVKCDSLHSSRRCDSWYRDLQNNMWL